MRYETPEQDIIDSEYFPTPEEFIDLFEKWCSEKKYIQRYQIRIFVDVIDEDPSKAIVFVCYKDIENDELLTLYNDYYNSNDKNTRILINPYHNDKGWSYSDLIFEYCNKINEICFHYKAIGIIDVGTSIHLGEIPHKKKQKPKFELEDSESKIFKNNFFDDKYLP
ncbi:MAG: hypothetical protein ACRC5W_10695 [Cetobacterium sp.]